MNHYRSAFNQIIDFVELLENSYNTKYYLVGGILVNLYSDFRITRDIDLALDLHSTDLDLEEFLSLLEKNKFHSIQDWKTTNLLAKETSIIQFLDKFETIRYDVHLISSSPSNKYKKVGLIALKRRVKETIFDRKCWVESKEDFILSKLVFGGWQDYTDALGCWLRFKSELDLNYLKKESLNLDIKREFEILSSGIKDPDEYFQKVNRY